jgi:hypothetical protein
LIPGLTYADYLKAINTVANEKSKPAMTTPQIPAYTPPVPTYAPPANMPVTGTTVVADSFFVCQKDKDRKFYGTRSKLNMWKELIQLGYNVFFSAIGLAFIASLMGFCVYLIFMVAVMIFAGVLKLIPKQKRAGKPA